MNKIMLIGRLTKDIELKQGNNATFSSFTLAVNRQYKKDGQPEADFISCKAFGKTAEFLGKYMSKGRQIAVEGRLQTGSYKNKEGATVYTTDVMVESVYFADSKQDKQEEHGDAWEPDFDDVLPVV